MGFFDVKPTSVLWEEARRLNAEKRSKISSKLASIPKEHLERYLTDMFMLKSYSEWEKASAEFDREINSHAL